jgi:hypothetical protein
VRWNIKINEDKTQAIYFSHRLRPPEAQLALNVKYIGVIFDKKIIWRLHLEIIEAKAFRTFIGIYSLLKSERLSAKIKLTLHKALIRAETTYACPAWELAAGTYLLKAAHTKQGYAHVWKFSKVYTGPRYAHSF